MKAHSRKRRPTRRTTPWFVLATMVGALPSLHATEQRPTVLTVDRRIALEPRRIEAALRHVKIWTPSETIGPLQLQDASGNGPVQATDAQPVFRFEIIAGQLAQGLQQFEQVTGLKVEVDAEIVRNLTTDGVSGVLTANQALTRLLNGTSLTHKFKDASTVAIEIRIESAAVNVTGSLDRVPSTKYAAALPETPQTIQLIPRTLIEEQGATTLSEALRNVPGITMQAGEGGGASNTTGDMFNMRGFSANNSLFVDGVRDDGLIARDVYNLEQIEVFSGPTGADVGRTNAAGYVNMTSKSPNLDRLEAGSISYGSEDQFRATVDLNQRLPFGATGTFLGNSAVRVNALWQDGGIAGRDYAGRESRAVAPSIAFGLNTPTRVMASGQIMRQDNLADYGLPAAASPVGPLSSTSVLAPVPVEQDTYYGSPDYDYDKVSQDSVLFRVEHDLTPGATLRNQTRYNTAERTAVITSIANAAAYNPETNLVTLSRQANERHNDIFSNQTSLVARARTGSIQHDLSVGLEVASESQFAPTLGGAGTRAPVDLNHPDVFSPVVGMAVAPTGALSEGSTDTVALYAFDGFDAGPRLRLNGGIRVERYVTRSHAVTATGAVTDLEGDGTLVSGKAGVVFRINDLGNIYASYGSSLTPPGSANFQLNAGAANQNNPNVDPQKSTNYEVGTKWALAQNRLQLSGAVFHTENENVIFVLDATAVPPIFNQDDGQLVKGVAFALIGQIVPRWDVNLSLQYLDSSLKSQNAVNNGNRLVLTPEVSGSLWTTVRLMRDIRVGGGLRYMDPVFVNAANTILVPRYTVADALLEAPLSRQLTLRLNVYNLTDRTYISSINNNGGRYNPGTPRSFLLSTAVRF
jgi:catecholate siderophore receptor